jgi:propionyl-CoA synthetase
MFCAPTAMRAIRAVIGDDNNASSIRNKYDTSSLKLFFVAGERSDPSTVRWCQKVLGVTTVDNYWQTETGAPISSAPFDPETKTLKVKIGSGGQAAPGWDLRVQSTDSEFTDAPNALVAAFPLAPGVFTQLWKRPGDLFKIYCCSSNNNNTNKKETESSDEFFYQTFDAGFIDEEQFLHIMSRSDDVINVSAHRLSTGQLEQAIATHSAIAESAVVGKPCDLKGSRPVAFVVVKAGYLHDQQYSSSSASSLEKSVNECLRSIVGPIASSEIIVVPKLPKTRSGKVLRKLLREIVSGVDRANLNISPTIEDLENVDVLVEIVKSKI